MKNNHNLVINWYMLKLVSHQDILESDKSTDDIYIEFLSSDNEFSQIRLLQRMNEKSWKKYIVNFLKYFKETGSWEIFFNATDKWYIKWIIAIFVIARSRDTNNSLWKYLDSLNASQLRYCYESVEKDYKIDWDDLDKVQSIVRQLKVKIKFREIWLREA